MTRTLNHLQGQAIKIKGILTFFFFLVFVLLEESEVPMERNSPSLKNIYHASTQLTGGFSCPLFYSLSANFGNWQAAQK